MLLPPHASYNIHALSKHPPPGWWYKPDFIINELNINSAISRPWHDEVLPLASNTPYTMSGYAYTGALFGDSLTAHVRPSLDGVQGGTQRFTHKPARLLPAADSACLG